MIRLALLTLGFWLIFCASAAAAPIITPILIAAIPAFGAGGALAGLTSFVSAAIVTGLAVGASLLMATDAARSPKPSDVSGTLKQDLPARMRHYGRRKVGGALLFIETKDGNLHMVQAHGDGPFSSFISWIIDDRDVELDVGGWVTSDPYAESESPQTVNIETRLGSTTQTAFDALVTDFPTIWTSAHQGNGIALSKLVAKAVGNDLFNQVYPNRIPSWNAIADTSLVHDPRTDTTVFSRNLALQLADYLTHPDGLQIPQEYINESRLIAAANVCDQAVTIKAGGTIPRYAGGLSYALNSEPSSVISRFLTAMDGRTSLLADGTIAIDAGAWVEPTVTVENKDIVSYSLRDSSGPLRESNEVLVKYTFVEAGYAETQCDPWRDEGDISSSGQTKTETVESYEIEHHNHARRIAKITEARSGASYQGQVTTNLSGMRAWDQRFIRIQGTLFELDHTFEVVGISLDTSNATVTIDVVSFSSTAYDFNAAAEEGTGPSLPEELAVVALPPPTGVVGNTSSRVIGDGVNVPVIVLDWGDTTRGGMTAQAQYSVDGSTTWTEMAVSQNDNRAEVVGVSTGVTYDMRVRYRGPGGSRSDWVVVENITPIADPTPPSIATGANATATGSGEVEVTWNAPNSANYRGARIYQNDANNFALSDLVATIYGAPNSSGTAEIDGLDPDTYWFWVVAINSSGTEAGPSATGSVVVS